MELNNEMKNCLLMVMEDPEVDIHQVVEVGLTMYAETYGTIEVEDDVEGEEFIQSAYNFVLDSVLASLILKGMVEVSGMQDDDFAYSLTETGKEVANRISEERGGSEEGFEFF